MDTGHHFRCYGRAWIEAAMRPRALLLLWSVCALTTPVVASDWAWLESETPTSKNMDTLGPIPAAGAAVPVPAPAPGHREFLSEKTWLNVELAVDRVEKDMPREGLILSYEFQTSSAGQYEIWNRVGYEKARSPFDWRVDQGEWTTIKPEEPTVDLMEIEPWCTVAWLKMGEAEIPAGKHVLEIRLKRVVKEEGYKKNVERISYTSDALCIHKGPFHPNGRFKPDEEWQTANDQQAAVQVFNVAAGDPASGERIETPLSGLWQVCRADEQEVVGRARPTEILPELSNTYWMGIAVPSNKYESKAELRLCHRFIYRTKVKIPAELAGRSFILRFPGVSLLASVHVNGKYCGWTKAPYALWECDVTSAIKPGAVNEICVVVKDTYYSISEKKAGRSCRTYFDTPLCNLSQSSTTACFDFPVGSRAFETVQNSGILSPPSLIVAGTVYVSDAFVQPSVKEKKIALEITVFNGAAAEKKIQVANAVFEPSGGKVEKPFTVKEMTLPAGKDAVLKLDEPWDDPKLWWPDEPNLHYLTTRILIDGKVVDVRKTTFGFREWECSGQQFKLNGIAWPIWSDDTAAGASLEDAVALWKKTDIRMCRLCGAVRYANLDHATALDYLDAHGMIVRRSGIFDGSDANYGRGLADNPELFDNWSLQLKAMVREERNHPSIMIWSLENELAYTNARRLGLSKEVDPKITQTAKDVMALDPTRPVMVDGGNCLSENALPVNGVHHMESFFRDYPEEAYTLSKASIAHEQNVLQGWGRSAWQLLKDRPIFMGEAGSFDGNGPAAYAQFAGEGCFAGWNADTRKGAGIYTRMLAEGYRWNGVAAFHLAASSAQTDGLQNNAYHSVCLFCREWNWTFGSGSDVSRTLKVFNDTRFRDPIEAAWQLTINGKPVVSDKKVFSLQAGEHEEFTIGFKVPTVHARTTGEFVLTCRCDGKEVFREIKSVVVIETNGPEIKMHKTQLVVVDPLGSIKMRLQARQIEFTDAGTIGEIPNSARVIVIGKDVLNAREAAEPRWTALAGSGKRLLVVEQTHPLHFVATPADFAPTTNTGRVAFMENTAHPIFAGLDQPDFFTWSRDQIVYRNAYRKATRGATSLADCDEQLGCSAISECQVNDGLLLLCQMVVGDKLEFDPVAQRLFDNMLAYCADYVSVNKPVAVVMDEGSPAAKLLADTGVTYDKSNDALAALSGGKYDILVAGATPAMLKSLADAPQKVNAFTRRGGWLMLWGVTPEGLSAFNQIVGVEHVLRPFELENVSLPARRDPLLSGLTTQDMAMETGEYIFSWSPDKYRVDDEFNYIVDLNDIAPFCEFPNAKAGDRVAARKAVANWPRNAVNGFMSADAWKLIYYTPTANPNLQLTLPRPEEIVEFDIVLNVHYARALKVNLYLDEDPIPISFATKPFGQRQNFPLDKPRKASRVRIELADFDRATATTGIDNFWICVSRSEEWRNKVKPLLNIGGLLKYQMGLGGIVLNQLLINANESIPENAAKKCRIVTALLRNMNARYAGNRTPTTGNLQFQPLSIDEQCNQHLTKSHGWFDGRKDLGQLPVGRNEFAGVTYEIRDYKSSPVPSCVILAGPGIRGQLPAEIALKAGRKADAIFFLHTFNRAKEWRARWPDENAPTAFKYVVHYADGQSVDIPVLYGEGVDHWITTSPMGLKSAALAWSARFPGDESPDEAAIYQMQWNNPRPDVVIQTIDLMYGLEGSKYGTPALLAITAGTLRP